MKDNQFKSDNVLLSEISNKLSELIAINGIANKEKDDQINYLINYGFSNSDIARIAGIPIGTVSTIRNRLNKKKS